MRVLHVHSGTAWRGGEQQVLDLVRGLAAIGEAQTCLVARGGALASRLGAAGLPVEPIPLRNEADPRALGRIVRAIRRDRPHVVHAHTSQAHGLAALAARLVGRRRPALVATRRVENSIFRHAFLGFDRIKYDPGVDLVVCVSARVRDVLLADGLAPRRLRVVFDGIDVDRARAPRRSRPAVRRDLGIPPGATVLLTVGACVRPKGQVDLLEAFAALPPTAGPLHLVIAGDGPLRRELGDAATRHGVAGRVHRPGHRDDVPDLLAAADLFVFPSREEGLGTSLLEAMAAGLPVVATRAGGIPEAVEDGVHGLLVPAADPAALARAIRRALDDPAAARVRAERARARVLERFTSDAMVRGTRRAYHHAVRLRRRVN